MFTGIIERTLRVIGVSKGPKFLRLTLPTFADDIAAGESIAINGVCLSVAEMSAGELGFDVIKETLERTNLGSLAAGDEVNIERSMRVGDRIDGHFVQGHIDATGLLINQINEADEWRLTIEAPPAIAKYVVPKGSIALDGVSLTIASVRRNVFEVALIPTTLKLTTLGNRAAGWRFNLEADILAKTVIHYLQNIQCLDRQLQSGTP